MFSQKPCNMQTQVWDTDTVLLRGLDEDCLSLEDILRFPPHSPSLKISKSLWWLISNSQQLTVNMLSIPDHGDWEHDGQDCQWLIRVQYQGPSCSCKVWLILPLNVSVNWIRCICFTGELAVIPSLLEPSLDVSTVCLGQFSSSELVFMTMLSGSLLWR